MNKNDQEFLVQKIRSQYTEKQHNELDELKALDKKVKKPAAMFAYIFGSIAALIMGAGMSLVMSDVSRILEIDRMAPGIVTGLLGMSMLIANYPIYKRILAKRRSAYAQQILELSEKLMN